MSIAMVVLIGVMFATGTYLMLHRTLTRIVFGIAVLGNGVNLLILAGSGPSGNAPIIGSADDFTDALPQALILTAIVIGFALQAFVLALAWRGWTTDGNDIVEDDIEDRRIAAAKDSTPDPDLGDADLEKREVGP